MHITKKVSREEVMDVFGDFAPDRVRYTDGRLGEGTIFIAKNDEDDETLGFLIYCLWWGDCPFIELITVKPAYQGQGIGRKLFDAAIEELRAQGYTEVVSSATASNQSARKFHDALGFQELGTLNLPHGEEQFYKIRI